MTRRISAEDFYALRLAEDPRVSPSGEYVAYVEMSMDRSLYAYRRSIRVIPFDGGDSHPVTTGPRDWSPRWSPDGRRLAFVRLPMESVRPRTAHDLEIGLDQPQVWIVDADGGSPRQLTSMPRGASDPCWSPDGTRLLVTARSGPGDDPESEAARVDEARAVPAVRTIDRLWYRLDGTGWIYDRPTRIYLVDAEGGEAQRLTDGDFDDAHPSWSPDGRRVAFASDRTAERWRWPAPSIWTLELESGDLARVSSDQRGAERPVWSPDGARIAYRAAPRRGPDGHVDLYCVPADGSGAERCISSDFLPGCANTAIDDQRLPHGDDDPIWSADGGSVMLLASSAGTTHLYRLDVDGGGVTQLTEGSRVLLAVSADGAVDRIAIAVSDPVTPGDIYSRRLNAAGETRLTEVNRRLFEGIELSVPEEFECQSDTGAALQAWVMRPPGPVERVTPAVLEVHGGPRTMYGWSFFLEFQLLAAEGMTVVYGNPRGSTGYGKEFAAAVAMDWGGGDHRDLLAMLDAAIAMGGIDADRLGVAGGSYGGYMTNWMVGHSDRFKAAVTMRCVSNFASFFGTSDLGWTLAVEEAGGTPWDDLDRLMDRSPIKYVGEVHTPLLIMHSEDDLRCPISEAEQMYAALKYLDREVKFVRFEGQSHDLSRNGHPRSRYLRYKHILGWFRDHLLRD